MSSGIAVGTEITDKFNEMKQKKTTPYIIFKISDDSKSIVIDTEGEHGDPQEEFDKFRDIMLAAAAKGEGRFAVYDVKNPKMTKESQKGSKVGDLLFVVWSSDEKCNIKQKMMLSSSKGALKKMLPGMKREMQINDESEMNLEGFVNKLQELK